MEKELNFEEIKKEPRTDDFTVHGVKTSDYRAVKVPGAVLSPESNRALQEELADIRRAEREGYIGADSYYLGTEQQP